MRTPGEILELAPAAAFEANPRTSRSLPLYPNGMIIFDMLVKKQCAGMNNPANSEDVYDALMKKPDLQDPAANTIRWFLGSLSMAHTGWLVGCCGIPLIRISEHVRAHGLIRSDMIRFLNQFIGP